MNSSEINCSLAWGRSSDEIVSIGITTSRNGPSEEPVDEDCEGVMEDVNKDGDGVIP